MRDTPEYGISTTLERADWNNTKIIKENVEEEIAELKQQSGRQILIDGSAGFNFNEFEYLNKFSYEDIEQGNARFSMRLDGTVLQRTSLSDL